MAQTRTDTGFTLIEVVVALAIVAITTALAVASYRGYLQRSHRIEAAQALLAVAAEQEKFHLAHGHYSDRLATPRGGDPPGLPVAVETPRGHYRLSVEAADAAGFRVVAIATDARGDLPCLRLSIDESGRRAAIDARGADSTRRCW